MKKCFAVLTIVLLIVTACSSNNTNADNTDSNELNITTDSTDSNEFNTTSGNDIDDSTDDEPQKQHRYIGDYEQDPVYQMMMEIETCQDPDRLSGILMSFYGEKFNCIKLKYKESNSPDKFTGYEAPYEEFICSSSTLYNTTSTLNQIFISSDTYLFFEPYNEQPLFMMDSNATYIVYSYKIQNLDDGTHVHSIKGWVISDLFMCLHGYIDADAEKTAFMREAVSNMDYYLELENVIINILGEHSRSIHQHN